MTSEKRIMVLLILWVLNMAICIPIAYVKMVKGLEIKQYYEKYYKNALHYYYVLYKRNPSESERKTYATRLAEWEYDFRRGKKTNDERPYRDAGTILYERFLEKIGEGDKIKKR